MKAEFTLDAERDLIDINMPEECRYFLEDFIDCPDIRARFREKSVTVFEALVLP